MTSALVGGERSASRPGITFYSVVISFRAVKTILTKISLHGAEPSLRNRQSLSYSRISQHFMEPEG
jgi:hypothetical protein